MAWIRYYRRLSHALVAVMMQFFVEWDNTRVSEIHDMYKAVLSCCMAARVRRSTAATGL